MRQVVIIHGGTSYNSYERYLDDLKNSPIDYDRLKKSPSWTEWIDNQMADADVLYPRFPNSQNAVYKEWKIYFEKLLPVLGDDVSLVGYSLGAMFLAQYLNDHVLENKVSQICLVAPSYDDESIEDMGTFKIKSASGLARSSDDIHIFHSTDDFVSPYTELAKFEADLPMAKIHRFTDRNHFFQPTLPELLEVLRQK